MRDSQLAKSRTEVSTGVLGPGSDLDPFGFVWVRSVSGVAAGLRADRDVVDAKEIRKLRVFQSFFAERDLSFSPSPYIISSFVCGLGNQLIVFFVVYIYIYYIVRLSRAPIDTLPSLSRSQTY